MWRMIRVNFKTKNDESVAYGNEVQAIKISSIGCEKFSGYGTDKVIDLLPTFIHKSVNKHAAKVMEAPIDKNNLLR